MTKIGLIAGTLLIASTVAASAHSNSVDRRQEHQANRIEHGRQTGQITWTEGLKLRAEQRRIARLEAKLRADGYLSRSDRSKLNELQRDARRHITKEAHDSKRRASWLPRVGF